MPLLPDTPFANGKYHIVKHLGAGASGDVYLARHVRFDRLEAVKMLSRAGEADSSSYYRQVRERFALEAQVGAQVRHANVIEVYDHDESDGMLYLTMQYASGGSVADAIATLHPLPIEQAVCWLRDAATGLAVLHDADVIHRDVKPSNLLVMEDGRVAVADLGLAQVAGGQLSQRASVGSAASLHPGTPDYMSPEHSSPRTLLPTSDVYSLGCVAFEMLTGRRYVQVQSRVEAPSALRSDVPAWLDELVRRMLLVDPGVKPSDAPNARKRFVRMEQVLDALPVLPDAPPTLLAAPAVMSGASAVVEHPRPLISDWAIVDASMLAAVVAAESSAPSAAAEAIGEEPAPPLEDATPGIDQLVGADDESPAEDAPGPFDAAQQPTAEREKQVQPADEPGPACTPDEPDDAAAVEAPIAAAPASATAGELPIADWARVEPVRTASSSTAAASSMLVPALVILAGVVFASLIILLTSR